MTKGLAHLALYCSDVHRSADFYVRVLGLKRLFTQKRPDGSLWYIYLHAGNRTFVELFPSDAPPADGQHTGVAHICLEVEDMEAAVARVKAEDWPLTSEPRTGGDGNIQAWLNDPDGVPVELMQMMPDCMQYKALEEQED